EEVGMRPHVGAVIVHEDGGITDDANSAGGAILPDGAPLLEEEKLDDAGSVDLDGELRTGMVQGRRLTPRQFARPLVPAFCVVVLAESIEQDKTFQPPGIFADELV